MTDKTLEKKINSHCAKGLASSVAGLVTGLGGIIVASDLGTTTVAATDQYLLAAGTIVCAGYMAHNFGKAIEYIRNK